MDRGARAFHLGIYLTLGREGAKGLVCAGMKPVLDRERSDIKGGRDIKGGTANVTHVLGRGAAKKIAGHIIPLTGIYFAVTEDIPAIVNFGNSVGQCVKDYFVGSRGALDNAHRAKILRDKIIVEGIDPFGIVDRFGGILTPLGGR